RGDEAPSEIGVHRTGADEKATAEGETERRLHARLQRADPLPRALEAALDGGVEAAAAGDLQIGEAGTVENLRERELLGRRHPPGERLLSEQADGRVGEGRHAGDLTALQATASSCRCSSHAR